MIEEQILVTGGAGFIGAHLCRALLEQGCFVLCTDNFYTSSPVAVQPLKAYPNFEFQRHDVCQPLWAEMRSIYNLACPASPEHYQRDPIRTNKTSVLGAFNMLGLAKRTGARILQASSSEVYGDPNMHPQHERYWGHVNPIGVRACYDEGKRCAETLFFDYKRQHNVDIRVARIFNTYGPGMHMADGRVVSNFILQALKGDPLTIYGDGLQTRSFCYVSDLVDGLIALMDTADEAGPFNVGNPSEITMMELAEAILRLTGSRSKIEHQPLPEDDPKQRLPDIGAIKEQTGWAPQISLEEGLKETIAYFRHELSIA